MTGKIHPSGTLILRESRGNAEEESGRKYELSVTMHGQPCVCSETTGKYFVLSWEEILAMAVEAGIDRMGG